MASCKLLVDDDDDSVTIRRQRGDFHTHPGYSDGQYTPAEQMENALSQQLDFIFLSDHSIDFSNWTAGAAKARVVSDLLLVGRAIEVTTRSGHWQAVGLDCEQNIEWRYKPTDDPGFVSVNQTFCLLPGL